MDFYLSEWRELFSWLKDPGSTAKIGKIALLGSFWFFILYLLWYLVFFLNDESFAGLFHHSWGWAIFPAFAVLPAANLLVFGYFKRYALELAAKSSSGLPNLEKPRELLELGAEVFALSLAVFSPALLCLILAVWHFLDLVFGEAFLSFGHSFFIVFLFVSASIFSLFSWTVYPVCFFRHLEDRDLRWALDVPDVSRDLSAIGIRFWRSFLLLTATGIVGESLLLLVTVLLAVSPLGILFAGLFFIFTSSVIFSVLAVSGIRNGVFAYGDLHYRF